MLRFPDINPDLIRIGPVHIRWYGLMYLAGFAASYYLVKRQITKKKLDITAEVLESLYFYLVISLIAGARLGYGVFYNLTYYLHNPLDIFAIWHGGMSFHGGLIGVIIGGYIFSRRKGINFLLISDLVTATAPIGLFLGRLGNFINGELYGRPSDLPWAMIFPSGGDIPRHPSQLYEAFFEGIVIFTVLWIVKDRFRREGFVTALFLILYGIARFFIEFFREPDPQLGFVIGSFSMGQVLCGAMVLAGSILLIINRRYGIKK